MPYWHQARRGILRKIPEQPPHTRQQRKRVVCVTHPFQNLNEACLLEFLQKDSIGHAKAPTPTRELSALTFPGRSRRDLPERHANEPL